MEASDCSRALHNIDNLLEDRDVAILIDGNKVLRGTKDTIDGITSTCLEIGRFYSPWNMDVVNCSWYVDFTTVRSVYEITVSLVADGIKAIQLSIIISNSSFEESGYLCAKEFMTVGYNISYTLKKNCTTHGRFVMIRMRLLGGYRPLLSICEVSITGCKDGNFGKNCNRNCSDNCVGKSCDIWEGKCLSGMCSDGWQEDCQQKCYNGTYGFQCKSRCGNCRYMEDCDHATGYCKGGCDDGWTGEKCDKQCFNGTYGYQCNSSCGKCKNIEDCHHVTGFCKGGCSDGSMGDKCDKVCPFGFYGNSCSERCNVSCDPETGQQKISEEGNKCAVKTEEDNDTVAYALGVSLTVSILVNIILVAICVRRFLITRKDAIHDNQSPVYLNVRYGNNKDNQPSCGEQMDKSNVQYEVLGVPSSETYYDDLK